MASLAAPTGTSRLTVVRQAATGSPSRKSRTAVLRARGSAADEGIAVHVGSPPPPPPSQSPTLLRNVEWRLYCALLIQAAWQPACLPAWRAWCRRRWVGSGPPWPTWPAMTMSASTTTSEVAESSRGEPHGPTLLRAFDVSF